MARGRLGVLEAEVLRATIATGADAYGLSIIRTLQLQTGVERSIGSIYTVLERLETKGFLASKWGEVTAERGGRRKRVYTVNAKGQMAAAGGHGEGRDSGARLNTGVGTRPSEARLRECVGVSRCYVLALLVRFKLVSPQPHLSASFAPRDGVT
ncbi:MAG: PadR family transcriptional regulator [Pseudomonadota bacterium]